MIQKNWELIFVGRQKYVKVVLYCIFVNFVGRQVYYKSSNLKSTIKIFFVNHENQNFFINFSLYKVSLGRHTVSVQ